MERRFGAIPVLRGVSLSARAGECHLVVGPNGAGKSTLLRLLAGLARPTSGVVLVGGVPLASEPTARRHIGLLSHQSHLYGDLTAVENLAFAARLYGARDAVVMARARLETVGLADRGDEPIRRLSRGMVQRVAIARALLHGPRLLLLDEPFTGLDLASGDRVAALLRGELGNGMTVVLASHDVQESWALATHTHLLARGAWVSSGPREDLDGFLKRYREVVRG